MPLMPRHTVTTPPKNRKPWAPKPQLKTPSLSPILMPRPPTCLWVLLSRWQKAGCDREWIGWATVPVRGPDRYPPALFHWTAERPGEPRPGRLNLCVGRDRIGGDTDAVDVRGREVDQKGQGGPALGRGTPERGVLSSGAAWEADPLLVTTELPRRCRRVNPYDGLFTNSRQEKAIEEKRKRETPRIKKAIDDAHVCTPATAHTGASEKVAPAHAGASIALAGAQVDARWQLHRDQKRLLLHTRAPQLHSRVPKLMLAGNSIATRKGYSCTRGRLNCTRGCPTRRCSRLHASNCAHGRLRDCSTGGWRMNEWCALSLLREAALCNEAPHYPAMFAWCSCGLGTREQVLTICGFA
ncbi:hypothetical protein VOLCADRAFT_93273 [Volvox carteri f. nagariensis]|uniref:Uncharacterized protein n=1 Tax=Volvox carteri f. nagariensis TaxID=3068 RepID=D8U1P9_VOLCA|nr:uncharacterized protein VOLCADRAFT_93273 [Volvox carteri f. nagariensis]EFJ46378.1 hypothetical protein VOLCADRAFT_93273 [Volvox carteri f. nagariensis]|eukprot:XP_002952531.1 hypothetical protein VOLCADRAFT_93273 [Volvox carteri f. nagariensis]